MSGCWKACVLCFICAIVSDVSRASHRKPKLPRFNIGEASDDEDNGEPPKSQNALRRGPGSRKSRPDIGGTMGDHTGEQSGLAAEKHLQIIVKITEMEYLCLSIVS